MVSGGMGKRLQTVAEQIRIRAKSAKKQPISATPAALQLLSNSCGTWRFPFWKPTKEHDSYVKSSRGEAE